MSEFEPVPNRETNPVVFLNGFFDSHEFHDARVAWSNIRRREHGEKFESSESARNALWEYVEQGNKIVYDSDEYTLTTKLALDNYFAIVKEFEKAEKNLEVSNEEKINLDHLRASYHTAAAEQLRQYIQEQEPKFMPAFSFTLSRTLVSILRRSRKDDHIGISK